MKICCWVFIACVLVSCKESDLFPNSVEKKEKKKVILDGPSKMTLNERVKVKKKDGFSEQKVNSYDYSIVDQKGKTLKAVVEAFDGSQIVIYRKSDNKRFLVKLDKLSDESKEFIINKGEFNEHYLLDYLDYRKVIDRFEEAKKIVNVDVLLDERFESEEAVRFFKKEKIRFYPEKLTGATIKDRSTLKEWGVNRTPAFKIGGEVFEGFDKEVILELILKAYDKRKR